MPDRSNRTGPSTLLKLLRVFSRIPPWPAAPHGDRAGRHGGGHRVYKDVPDHSYVLFRALPLCMGLLVGYPHGPLPLVATRPGNNGGGHLLYVFLFSVLLHL